MKKTPREQIEAYIQKNIAKEKDKWEVGNKSDYYKWQEALDDWRSKNDSVSELNEWIQVYKKFIKDMGLEVEFRKWRGQ